MDTCESVFPFVCDNPDCSKEYDLKKLSDVFLLWGIIYLTDNRHNLIGMTCPDCHHTTLRKFETSVNDFSIEKIIETLKKDYAGTEIKPDIKYMVPFSIQILESFGLIEKNALEQDVKSSVFAVPSGFTPITDYPQYIQDQFPILIYEDSITKLLEIENQQNIKAFPRVVDYFSPYKSADPILQFDSSPVPMMDEIKNNILISVMREALIDVSEIGPLRFLPTSYQHLMCRGKLEKELFDIDLSEHAITKEDFSKNIEDVLVDFKILRNQIDFEISYRNFFADMYCGRIYNHPGYHAEYMDEMNRLAELALLAENDVPPDNADTTDSAPVVSQPADIEKKKITIPKDNTTLTDLLGADESYKDKPNVFIRKNDTWYVKFQENDTTIANNKKINYLVFVLNQPGKHINYLRLTHAFTKYRFQEALEMDELKKRYNMKESKDGDEEDSNDGKDNDGLTIKRDVDLHKKTEKNLSAETESKIEARVEKLYADKLKAENENDLKKLEFVDNEIKRISIILEEYGARITESRKSNTIEITERKLSDLEKKVYKNIFNNLTNAFNSFKKTLPELERHLRQCIDRRPTYVVYQPENSLTNKAITWHISW